MAKRELSIVNSFQLSSEEEDIIVEKLIDILAYSASVKISEMRLKRLSTDNNNDNNIENCSA